MQSRDASKVPLWAQRLRWIIRGGAAARLHDVRGASAAAQWAILVVLADVATDDGAVLENAAPTAATLGKAAQLSENAARRALHALASAGLVQVTGRTGAPSLFALITAAIEACDRHQHTRTGGTPPTMGPLPRWDPSHDGTPPTMGPLPRWDPSHDGTPPTMGGDPSHGGSPTPPTMGPDPSHRGSPHPYGSGGSDLDRGVGSAPASTIDTSGQGGSVTKPPSPPSPKAKAGKRHASAAVLPGLLSPDEQRVHDAIAADPDLVAICARPEEIARDLLKLGAARDLDGRAVCAIVIEAGAYLRTDKGRGAGYSDGARFLHNQVKRARPPEGHEQSTAETPADGPPRERAPQFARMQPEQLQESAAAAKEALRGITNGIGFGGAP